MWVDVIIYYDEDADRFGWEAFEHCGTKSIRCETGYRNIGNARRAYKTVARHRKWQVQRLSVAIVYE